MTINIPPVDVRLAAPEDREAILRLTVQLHSENGLCQMNPAKVEAIVDRYYNRDRGVIGVVGEIGNPVAGILLCLNQLNYSDDWMLVEEFNFVTPEHRRSTYARQLISYAKQVSDQMKVPLMIGILSNTRTEAKVRLYEQMLDKAGAYFLYGIDYLTAPAWKKTG